MELEAKMSLLPSADKQETTSMELNKSAEMYLLSECQSQVEGAVIIYDTESQQTAAEDKCSEDPDNFITLHASTDTKSEPQEEVISTENVGVSIKSSPQKSEEAENDTDDDETIATFLTSTGQQLALYAVEDSDEIFAVALYDESGEPPTNFHFLMKADVERLIGEGAVKTVKKPQAQPKKESKPDVKKEEIKFETFSEFRAKAKKEEAAAQLKKVQQEIKTEIVEVPGPQPKPQVSKPQPKVVQKVEQKKTIATPNHNLIHKNLSTQKVSLVTKPAKPVSNVYQSPVIKPTKPVSNVYQPCITKPTKSITNVYQPRVMKPTKPVSNVYQPRMKEVKKETKVAYVVSNASNENQYIIDHALEDLDSDAEIIEQSTVQYILCDGDPSDSELTFDELQASLMSFKTNKPISNIHKTNSTVPQKSEKKNENIIRYSSYLKSSSKVAPILCQKKEPVTTVYRTYSKGPKKTRMTNNLLHPIKKIKQEVVDTDFGDISTYDDGNMSSDDLSKSMSKQDASMTDDSPSKMKAKRSRKQQLTMVNRTDSEIIIQPASAYSEEDDEPVSSKKRGRRKKKATADPDYSPRKPLKKTKKPDRSVEVIEIDVEDSEKSGVHDSALEGNKSKGSSDKENDSIISVNDSGHEQEEETVASKKAKTGTMQCTDCNRNFRKRKALEKHVQACPKSPAYIQKMEEKKQLAAKGEKRFKCKSCDEKFDIAVALARHVRVIHSLKKKGRLSKGWTKIEVSESSDSEEEEEEVSDKRMEESSPEPELVRKKRGRPPGKKNVVNESPSSNIELKLDSSTETLHQEPKRRGRPPGRKPAVKERSATPNRGEKEASTTDSSTEKQALPLELRKRRRSGKRSISKERSLSLESVDKLDNVTISCVQLRKKRGRPTKRNMSKEEELVTPDVDDKNESSTENEKALESTPIRKRGRPPKSSLSKDDRSASSEVDDKNESSDEMPLEVRKRARDRKISVSKGDRSDSPGNERNNESSGEISQETCNKAGTSNICTSIDDTFVTPEMEEKDESSDETPLQVRKENRLGRTSFSKDDNLITAKAEEQNESSDETPLEARKNIRINKQNILKNDRPVSPETEDKTLKVMQETSKEAILLTPNLEKKEEKMVVSEEQSADVPAKETVEETKQGSKDKPISEPPKKRKQCKEESSRTDDLASMKTEDKVESSVESLPEIRKRGRPAKSKSVKGNESETAEVEEKTEESAIEAPEEPSRKKTRSIKEIVSVEEESEAPKVEDKSESNSETPSEARRRGRPSKARPSFEDDAEATVVEGKTDSSTTTSTEPRKRGRPSKIKTSIEEESEIIEIEEIEKPAKKDSEEKVLESFKEVSPEPARKRGKSSKECLSKDDESEIVDVEEKSENTSEIPRKRGRPSKDRSSKSENSEDLTTETEKKEVEKPAMCDKDKGKTKKKIPSPNRTWKVKKLNCEDCGKWFSSATLLRTHRLQHKTKKFARLDADRCPLCRKVIPGDLFTKHMASVHKKKSPISIGITRRVVKPATKSRSARTLRSSS